MSGDAASYFATNVSLSDDNRWYPPAAARDRLDLSPGSVIDCEFEVADDGRDERFIATDLILTRDEYVVIPGNKAKVYDLDGVDEIHVDIYATDRSVPDYDG